MIKKLDVFKYDTDKQKNPYLVKNYEEAFSSFLEREVVLLELGVLKAGSLFMWRDYFEKGKIIGLDLYPVKIERNIERIKIYQGKQQDIRLLDRIAKESAPSGFDIIIDDCSHIGEYTRISFWHLFENYLKPDGLFIIEDWGTGYWSRYIDGKGYRPKSNIQKSFIRRTIDLLFRKLEKLEKIKQFYVYLLWSQRIEKLFVQRRFRSHNYGMVGFVKELIDECGISDITDEREGNGPKRNSKFEKIQIAPGQVIVKKAHTTQ